MSDFFLDGMAADLAAIHGELGEFTESIRIRYPAFSSAPTVDIEDFAIFNERYMTADPDTGVPVMSAHSSAIIHIAAIEAKTGEAFEPQVKKDNILVTMRGQDFRVAEYQPDGFGCAVLVLKKE